MAYARAELAEGLMRHGSNGMTSMGSDASSPAGEGTIAISRSDGWFVARDEKTGVSSQGETRSEALENLADALRLYDRPEPDDVEDPEPSDAPWL